MNTLSPTENPSQTCLRAGVALCLLLAALDSLALTEPRDPDIAGSVFYTFALTAIVVSTAIILAYRQLHWLAYVLLSLLLLCSVASMDGTLGYLLGGGEFVRWVVPYLFLSTTTAVGFLVAALRLEPSHRLARLRPVFIGLSLLTALFPLSSALWLKRIPLDAMWVPVNLLFFAMLFAQALPPLTWVINDRLQRLLTRTFPLVVAGFAVAVQLVHYLGEGLSQAQMNQLNRLTALMFTLFSLAIVVWQVVANTREKIRSERKALEAERNEAQMQLELARAEADYQEALSLAARHRTRLATVSHDLKQPIASLRYAVDQMQRAGHRQDAQKLSQAVDYVASLSHAYIEDDAAADPGDDQAGGAGGEPELIDSRVFARMLEQMFTTQAGEQGVRLRIICPQSSVHVEPLSCMRIMTNLAGNALAHAAPTRILVGFRPRGEHIVFQVVDDGIGMDEQTLAEVSQQGVKGADSDGQGLGLSIVRELCSNAQFSFRLQSSPGAGTCAQVSLPRHR